MADNKSPFSLQGIEGPKRSASASPFSTAGLELASGSGGGGGESGGGVLGALGRLPGDVASGLKDVATGFVPGIKIVATAGAKDLWGITRGDFDFNNSLPIAVGILKQMGEDLRHPLRDPVSTFLTGLSIVSGGAGLAGRVGTVGKLASEGASAGKIAKTAAFGKPLERRVIRVEGKPDIEAGYYARPVLSRQIQKLVDRRREINPTDRYLFVFKPQMDRYGTEQIKKLNFAAKADRALTREFERAASSLDSAEQKALQYYAENVGPAKRTEHINSLIDQFKQFPENIPVNALADAEREAVLIKAAEKYVRSGPDGGAEWAPGTEKLQKIYGKMENLVNRREELLTKYGLMDRAGLSSRVQKAADLLFGGRYYSADDYKSYLVDAEREIRDIDRRAKRAESKISAAQPTYLRKGITSAQNSINNLIGQRNKIAPNLERFVLLKKFFDGEDTVDLPEFNALYSEDVSNRLSSAVSGLDKAESDFIAARNAVGRSGRQENIDALNAARANLKAARDNHKIAKRMSDDFIRSKDKTEAQLSLEYENLKEFYLHVMDIDRQIISLRNKIELNRKLLDVHRKSAGKKPSKQLIAEAGDLIEQLKNIETSVIVAQRAIIENLLTRKGNIQRVIDEKAKDVGKIVGAVDAPRGRLYIPTSLDKASKRAASISGIAQRGIWGIPRKPGFLKPFTGVLSARGGGRIDKANLLAEQTYELLRFTTLLAWRNDMIRLASKTPEGMKNPIAIRLDVVKNQSIPESIQEIAKKIDSSIKLSKDDRDTLAAVLPSYQDELFDKKLSARAKIDNLGEVDGYVWIEKGLLGGLDEPSYLVGLTSGAGKHLFAAIDNVNDITKAVTLYTRPATVAPNILSGIGLNLIQQGMFAPINIARSFLLNKKLGSYEKMLVDEYMGEGRAGALRPSVETVGRRLVAKGAEFYGKIQDAPFRRASFLHEARVAGFKTNKQLRELLTSDANKDTLYAVVERANKAIIDYSELNRFERDFLRRIFYFYPWISGATRYSGRFVRENPIQAGVASQLGQYGAEQEKSLYGELPSWARGLVQVGERGGFPLTVTTQNILPFTTASDVADVLAGGVVGGTRGPEVLAGQFSPVVSSLISTLTGRSDLGAPLPSDRGVIEQFIRQVYEGTPQYQTVKKLIEGTEGKVYPASSSDLIRAYLASTIFTPRPTDFDILRRITEMQGAK